MKTLFSLLIDANLFAISFYVLSRARFWWHRGSNIKRFRSNLEQDSSLDIRKGCFRIDKTSRGTATLISKD